MVKIVSSLALAAALSLAPVLGTMPAAHAQGYNIEIGPGGVRAVPEPEYGYEEPDLRRDERSYRRGCSEREALSAARDEGLRRASVVRVTRRSITVQGYTRGGTERIRFANTRGCPTIG